MGLFSINVLGQDELMNNLQVKLPGKVHDAAVVAIDKAGLYLQSEVKASIAGERDEPRSVDTGAFIDSISEVSNDLSAEVGTDVPYAVFLEEGTRNIDARHHFGNSVARNKDEIVGFVREEIQKEL